MCQIGRVYTLRNVCRWSECTLFSISSQRERLGEVERGGSENVVCTSPPVASFVSPNHMWVDAVFKGLMVGSEQLGPARSMLPLPHSYTLTPQPLSVPACHCVHVPHAIHYGCASGPFFPPKKCTCGSLRKASNMNRTFECSPDYATRYRRNTWFCWL